MPHVALLGDSIFDNQAYVNPGEPDVVHQLRPQLPPDWKATLLAVDGSVTADVPRQLKRLPPDVTHLVISSGGNDALGHLDVLGASSTSVADVLNQFAGIQDNFERSYRQMLDAVLARGLPIAVCTVYNGNFPDKLFQHVASLAVGIWDDVILQLAIEHRLPVLELRLICADPSDYANPIEPSARGGNKIASAIAALLTEHDFTRRRTEIYTLPVSGL